jgi:hypothetical protein
MRSPARSHHNQIGLAFGSLRNNRSAHIVGFRDYRFPLKRLQFVGIQMSKERLLK